MLREDEQFRPRQARHKRFVKDMAYIVRQTQLKPQTVLSESVSPQPSKATVNTTSPKINHFVTSQARKLRLHASGVGIVIPSNLLTRWYG